MANLVAIAKASDLLASQHRKKHLAERSAVFRKKPLLTIKGIVQDTHTQVLPNSFLASVIRALSIVRIVAEIKSEGLFHSCKDGADGL